MVGARLRRPWWAVMAAVAALLGAVAPAAAELDATGTRLSVNGGSPRFFMSYGYPNDPEFYAPIAGELRRHQVTIQLRPETLVVYHKGNKVAEWYLVTDRDNIPDNPNVPFVPHFGGQAYLPVKAICDLVGLDVNWDRKGNLVALVPGAVRTRPNITVKPPQAPPNSTGERRLATLTDLQVEQKDGKLTLRVRLKGTVVPQAPFVVGVPPRRLVLDFPNSRWAPDLAAPNGQGEVTEMRIGHPTPTTARLTLVIPNATISVNEVLVSGGEIESRIGRGPLARTPRWNPVYEALLKRQHPLIARGDRNGNPVAGYVLDPDGQIIQQQPVRPLPPFEIGPVTPTEEPGAGGDLEQGAQGRYEPATTLAGRTIVVDAGHGGRHAGAKGLNYLEKDLCLKMARELEASLTAKGARVIMTRTADVFVHLDTRCQIANTSGADIFISIHCNSMPRRNMQSGSETYWYSSQQSLKLARALHSRMCSAVGGRNGGIRRRSFQVIRETNIPSVLLEVAYINNTQDEILLSNGLFHQRLAEHLTRGVLDYFGKEIP